MNGANIELHCASGKFLPVDTCMDFWRDIGFSFTPIKMVTLEAWPWEGAQEQCPPVLDGMEDLVKTGKIVFLYGGVDGINAGIEMERTDEPQPRFITEFWANVALLPEMDYSPLDGRPREVERFYSRVEKALARFDPFGLLLAGIGVENYVCCRQTIEETMAHSHVDRWLFPKRRD